MSSGIIGNHRTAKALFDALGTAGAETEYLGSDYQRAGEFDILLLAENPYHFPTLIPQLAPHMKPGQTVLLGNGSVFGTWTVTKALFSAKAPMRTIVGMCDAWGGGPVNVGTVQVSAHNFVYTQFLGYVASELFDTVLLSGSPLKLSFTAPRLALEFSPIARAAGDDALVLQARQEAVEIGRLLGTEQAPSEPANWSFDDPNAAMRAAAVNLYPLVTIAKHLQYSAPALSRLLETADEITGGKVSQEGAAHMPKPELLLEDRH